MYQAVEDLLDVPEDLLTQSDLLHHEIQCVWTGDVTEHCERHSRQAFTPPYVDNLIVQQTGTYSNRAGTSSEYHVYRPPMKRGLFGVPSHPSFDLKSRVHVGLLSHVQERLAGPAAPLFWPAQVMV